MRAHFFQSRCYDNRCAWLFFAYVVKLKAGETVFSFSVILGDMFAIFYLIRQPFFRGGGTLFPKNGACLLNKPFLTVHVLFEGLFWCILSPFLGICPV